MTVLGIYGMVASLVIIILGMLLVTGDDCDENSLTGSKDLKVEAGGNLMEVHNKVLKFDLFNQDNGDTGRTAGVDCPVCTVSIFTTFEIIGLTLLCVLLLSNFGRLIRYIVKLVGKHKLKKAAEKVRLAAETRKQIIQELEMERGIANKTDFNMSNKDDQEIKVINPSWEDAVIS